MYNLGHSLGAMLIFVYSIYKKGRHEEELADKYLYMFNDDELKHFDLNPYVYFGRIRASFGTD